MASPSARGLFALFAIVAIAGFAIARDNIALNSQDGETAQRVARIIQSRHIAHPEIDDNLSQRLLNRYVDAWDHQKLYFLQSDIDEFEKSAKALDDRIQSGNVKFATDVF